MGVWAIVSRLDAWEGGEEGGQEGGWVGAELTGILPRIDRMLPTAMLKQYSRG